MSREIVVSNPGPNKDAFSSWSYPGGKFILEPQFEIKKITPVTHPKVADLCAGDGSVARILKEMGWKEEDILCIDEARSTTPLVEHVAWKYWNLSELGYALRGDKVISPEIQQHKGRFDMVLMFQGYIGQANAQIAADFLGKP